MIESSELPNGGVLRFDAPQPLTPNQQQRARVNLRSLKAPDYTQAHFYGFGALVGGSSIGDDGESYVLLNKTTNGHWSSDGLETAALVGPWLIVDRLVEPISQYLEFDDEGNAIGSPVDVDTIRFAVRYFEDGVQDATIDWTSENTIDLEIFDAVGWQPVVTAGMEQVYVRIEPVEPEIVTVEQLAAELATRLEVVAVTEITDSSMTALGFTDQIEVTHGADTWFIPVGFNAWS